MQPRMIVTGPSLTSSTSIADPNRPVATELPSAARLSQKWLYSGSAVSGRTASENSGRLPFDVSP